MNKIKIFGKDIEDIGLIFLCTLASLFLFLYDGYEINHPFACKSPLLYSIAISLLFLLFIKVRLEKSQEVKNLASIPIVAYAVLIVLSAFCSKYQDIVYWGFPQRLEGSMALLSYIVIYFSALNLIKTNKAYTLLYALLVSCSAVAIIGLLEFYGKNPFLQFFKYIRVGENYKGTIYSTIGNQNFIGSLLCLTLLISIILFVLGKHKFQRVFFFLTTIFLYGGLIVSRTRSAWIGAFCGFVLLFIILAKNKVIKKLWKRLLLLFALFCIISISISITSEGRVGANFSKIFHDIMKVSSEYNNPQNIERIGSNRIYIWKKTIPLIKDYYLLGSGPDTLSKIFPHNIEDYIRLYGSNNVMVDKAHNEFLQIGVTTGVFSLLAYLGFIGLILYKNIKIIFKLDLFNTYDLLILASIIGCIGYLIQAFFNISVVPVAPIFWMVLGLNQNLVYKYLNGSLYKEEFEEESEKSFQVESKEELDSTEESKELTI